MRITVGLADNDKLFLASLSLLINSFPQFEVVTAAYDGQGLLDNLSHLNELPDLLLLDVNMPEKDGAATAKEIKSLYPPCKMIALSLYDQDLHIIRMIRSGCCAYLLKAINPDEFPIALQEVYEKGYYNKDIYNLKARVLLRQVLEVEPHISERDKEFLQLASTDMTYKQIADRMHLSARTIDGYREALFEKFNVQSRVGMVLEGIRRQIITI